MRLRAGYFLLVTGYVGCVLYFWLVTHWLWLEIKGMKMSVIEWFRVVYG